MSNVFFVVAEVRFEFGAILVDGVVGEVKKEVIKVAVLRWLIG
jgi:hypothetical protein